MSPDLHTHPALSVSYKTLNFLVGVFIVNFLRKQRVKRKKKILSELKHSLGSYTVILGSPRN